MLKVNPVNRITFSNNYKNKSLKFQETYFYNLR